MGKAAIYNPYLDTLGGGEKYTLTFAKVLAEEGYDVDIEWKDTSIKEKLSNRFGLKLPQNIKVVESVNRGENYDLIFWVTDGSIPTLRSSKNYLHFQVPFHDVNGRSLLNKMKFFRVNGIICNSNFTKKVVDKEYGVDSIVLYPPVSTNLYKPKRKTNQICYIARFSNLTQNKGHEILIKEFKRLSKDKKFTEWKLVFAGGTEVGADVYLKRLKLLAKGVNIEFIESPTVEVLKDIFGKSKIFWSGAGFNEDEIKKPEKVEHFGITLVESMSAGCVPVVYNAGGYKEIINNGKNGFLWQNSKELINITKKLVNEGGALTRFSKEAVQSSKKYGYEEFKREVKKII
ncbi:MAG: glycosyl transferase family 2 [uncultured bacterium]|nr:MAG: glycosyl transferase family 2 [uncultured bacterium]